MEKVFQKARQLAKNEITARIKKICLDEDIIGCEDELSDLNFDFFEDSSALNTMFIIGHPIYIAYISNIACILQHSPFVERIDCSCTFTNSTLDYNLEIKINLEYAVRQYYMNIAKTQLS